MSTLKMVFSPLQFGCRKKCFAVGNISSYSTTNGTSNDQVDKSLLKATGSGPGSRINNWLNIYEDVVGLTEVRHAQNKVIQAETQFMDIQSQRRRMQEELVNIQSRLRSITAEREKTSRVDENYLDLVTNEHKVLREENDVTIRISTIEKLEREHFTSLSAALRESHEKERTRTERMKYWSIIGSFVGVTIGVIGSTLNKHFQMREIRKIVQDTHANSEDYTDGMKRLLDATSLQHKHIEDFIEEIHDIYGSGLDTEHRDKLSASARTQETTLNEILAEIKRSDALLESEIHFIKSAITNNRNFNRDFGDVKENSSMLKNYLPRHDEVKRKDDIGDDTNNSSVYINQQVIKVKEQPLETKQHETMTVESKALSVATVDNQSSTQNVISQAIQKHKNTVGLAVITIGFVTLLVFAVR